jgi:acyl carrier protein
MTSMTEDDEVFAWLQDEIAERRQIRKDMVRPESSLSEDLLPDSFEMIELVTAIENRYGLRINYESVVDLDTIAEIVHFIQQNRD